MELKPGAGSRQLTYNSPHTSLPPLSTPHPHLKASPVCLVLRLLQTKTDPHPPHQHGHNPDPQRWEHRLARAETRTLKDTQRHAAPCRFPTPPAAHKHSCEMCVHTSLQKLHTHARVHTHTHWDIWMILQQTDMGLI